MMGFEIRRDGTIIAGTLEEALLLQRAILAGAAAPGAPDTPPLKRPMGSGSIVQTPRGYRIRIRIPGGRIDRGGFRTRAAAEEALNAVVVSGREPPQRMRRASSCGRCGESGHKKSSCPTPAPVVDAPAPPDAGHRVSTATAADRDVAAAHVRRAAISDRKGKFVFAYWLDGRVRWGGTFDTREAAEEARGRVADAIARGEALPVFTKARRRRIGPDRRSGNVATPPDAAPAPPSIGPPKQEPPGPVAVAPAPPAPPAPPALVPEAAPVARERPARPAKGSPEYREKIREGMRAVWARRRAARAAAEPPAAEHRVAIDGEDAPPVRRPARNCGRCGIPGHNAATCDAEPPAKADRLVLIQRWARRQAGIADPPPRPAPAPPAPPHATPVLTEAITQAVHLDLDDDSDAGTDFTEFYPDLVLPPEPPPALESQVTSRCGHCAKVGHWIDRCPELVAAPLPAPPRLVAIRTPLAGRVRRTIKGSLTAEERAAAQPYPEDAARPRTRGECVDGPRPCPFASCRHHLAIEVSDEGVLKHNHPGIDVADMAETCSLDVADRDGTTLDIVGQACGVTRERARQIEVSALETLKRRRGDQSLAIYRDGAG